MGLSLTQGNFVSDDCMAVKLYKKLKNNDIKFLKSRLKFVPEVSVMRLGQALFVIIGCKGYVGSF